VSLAGGQAEIAPGANPGSKIRGFGSGKHLDEVHQSRTRASLRAGTSRLTERGEKGGKNGEMTRVGAILRGRGSLADRRVFARAQDIEGGRGEAERERERKREGEVQQDANIQSPDSTVAGPRRE